MPLARIKITKGKEQDSRQESYVISVKGRTMIEKSLIADEGFWRVLCHYEALEEPWDFQKFLKVVDVSSEKFFEIASFLQSLGQKIEVSEQLIQPPAPQKLKIQLEISLSEWIAVQAQLPEWQQNPGNPATDLLVNKIAEMLTYYNFPKLAPVLHQEHDKQQAMEKLAGSHTGYLKTLEECVHRHQTLEIQLEAGGPFDVYLHKIVYLDGALCVVGEDCSDRCLVYFDTSEIMKIKKMYSSDYKANFSQVEVNDFIFAIRAVSGNEERLVLKIRDQQGIDLAPAYHFLGNPYVTSNLEGDMIWAASVEISEGFFEWLYELRSKVEILDPIEVKENFEAFCHQKTLNARGSKAS